MEYPEELNNIFEDPIFDNIRPKTVRQTVDERLVKKLEEITNWVETNGHLPSPDGDFRQKGMLRALESMRNNNYDALKDYDRLNLLDYGND